MHITYVIYIYITPSYGHLTTKTSRCMVERSGMVAKTQCVSAPACNTYRVPQISHVMFFDPVLKMYSIRERGGANASESGTV